MTIAKKLILAAACIMGIQYSAYGYNPDSCQSELVIMLDFSGTLQQIRNNKQALRLAQWLQDQVLTQQHLLSDQDIIAIANVITNPSLTLKSKCTMLTQVMALQTQKIAQEKAYQRRSAINQVFEAIAITTTVAGILALLVYDALYIQPLRPKVIVPPTPVTRISYSLSSGWSFGYDYLYGCYGWTTPTQVNIYNW